MYMRTTLDTASNLSHFNFFYILGVIGIANSTD